MKTWLSTSLAILLGFTAARTMGSYPLFDAVAGRASALVLDAGLFILLPLVFVTMAAGVASLRKDKGALAPVLISSAAWSVFSALALSLAAGLAFALVPSPFPAELGPSAAEGLEAGLREALREANPLARDPFSNLFSSPSWLLPVAFTAFVLGYAMKPSSDPLKPAYAVANSLSEVMHRLSRLMARLCWVFVLVLSARWFRSLGLSGLLDAPRFSIFLAAAVLAALFALVPLMFGIFTGFRGNPYRIFARTFASSASGLFSGDILFALPPLYHLERRSAGVQKRVSSTTLPLATFITRGGTAMVATICLCAMLRSKGALGIGQAALAALACSAFSLICSWSPGQETAFVALMAARALGLDAGADLAALGLLPVLNGAGVFVDIVLAAAGAFVAGKAICGVAPVAYKDTL